ncbi:hypothetical protein SAMN00768000_1203 [Sulfobacillus thermosulfidooxidans DSM 9293]|uniref:DUF998 domain-containing protein n=1 Tax=Sulfobacillus thermosulfidooxidans (strain DSM 9293 / VKM B-1269 / AT-1) TaxID=929705 RepID=A0A1W1WBX1_SULTA|nr:hypothetical protein [Sulfobacillus thermosulfidooxidans]SMC03669.1 hypothetical protein SAMN00768000_1203 [Sulfobacillus thermosulfidooxidans DSM 9293]
MVDRSVAARNPVQAISGVMVGLLLVQFVLGMYTNLYVTLPSMNPRYLGIPMGFHTMISRGFASPIFMIHMMLGVFLVVLSLITALKSLSSTKSSTKLWSGIGLVAVVVAGYSGLTFFMDGQHNSDSFTMAIAWLIALSAYLLTMLQKEI